ncbi:MAG: sulfatase-like hydrolase/transferase [Thermomicrobiales bacterium]
MDQQVASHFGGTRNPMIISWPERIKDAGSLREQFLHVIDIVPTLYDLCGITPPRELNGVQQKPIEGRSFADVFDDASAISKRTTQYFELGCNRGLYHDGWMASCPSFVPWDPNRSGWDPDAAPWELYNIKRTSPRPTILPPRNPIACVECRTCGG